MTVSIYYPISVMRKKEIFSLLVPPRPQGLRGYISNVPSYALACTERPALPDKQ